MVVKEVGCDVDVVRSVVQKHVPDATVSSDISLDISFVLPHKSKTLFAMLFDEIDQRKVELKISSYGTSATTMEEVFIR